VAAAHRVLASTDGAEALGSPPHSPHQAPSLIPPPFLLVPLAVCAWQRFRRWDSLPMIQTPSSNFPMNHSPTPSPPPPRRAAVELERVRGDPCHVHARGAVGRCARRQDEPGCLAKDRRSVHPPQSPLLRGEPVCLQSTAEPLSTEGDCLVDLFAIVCIMQSHTRNQSNGPCRAGGSITVHIFTHWCCCCCCRRCSHPEPCIDHRAMKRFLLLGLSTLQWTCSAVMRRQEY
jgi:hypothetical protein